MNPQLNALQIQHAFWISNLSIIIDWFKEVKDENVDLESFNDSKINGSLIKPKVNHTCGSVACIGGWVAVLPYFNALGIKRDKESGAPVIKGNAYKGNAYDDGAAAAALFLFGDESIFFCRTCEEDELADKTDREIAIRRLKKRLKVVRKLEKARMAENES